jgi:hypothetical protein
MAHAPCRGKLCAAAWLLLLLLWAPTGSPHPSRSLHEPGDFTALYYTSMTGEVMNNLRNEVYNNLTFAMKCRTTSLSSTQLRHAFSLEKFGVSLSWAHQHGIN